MDREPADREPADREPADREAVDWARVEDIFHELSGRADLSADERRAEAEATCGDDPRVLSEVLRLLGGASGGERLEGSIRHAMDAWLDEGPLADWPDPEEIGPYRVIERLGEGGLAVVYLAERTEPYHQRVAVKLLKRGLETQEILRRLKLEGQILARLEHPQIARLLDGGWTDDGRPYFVLEYVDGEPIDRYCERAGLGLRERLQLFRDVCLTVQQAHNRLVIHRDLKPSNLLVTGDGVPKLLDFGIAKLLDSSRLDAPDLTAIHTRPGAQWLTLAYAAPEQVAGGELTTAVDVYALGVVLYQLLSGRLPRDLSGLGAADVERRLAEDPEPPSRCVKSAASVEPTTSVEPRALRGDLDNLVAKAMAYEPDRRYASVQQLADDVDRYLRSEPLMARGDSWGYRTAKFLRRHRTAVLAAAAVFLALVASVVASTRALQVAERQRALAEDRLDQMEAVVDFTTGMFEIADPGEARGSSVTAREILDRGAARVADEMSGQPAVAARLMDTMGQVYRNLGLYSSARELLQRAASSWRAAGERRSEELDARRRLVGVLFDEGRLDEAATALDEVQTLEEELANQGRLAAGPRAATLHLAGLLARQLEGPEAAEPVLRQALALRQEQLDAQPSAAAELEVAESRNDLGQILFDLGDVDSAVGEYELALDARRRQLGPDHPLVAETLHNLATCRERRGDLGGAERDLRQVLEIRRALLGDVHRDVAVSRNNLAQVLHRQDRHGEALDEYRRALDIARQTVPEHVLTSQILGSLALELRDVGETSKAVDAASEALDLRRRLFGERSEQVVLPEFNHALLLAADGRRAEAIRRLQANVEHMRDLGFHDVRLSYSLTLLAELWAEGGLCDLSGPAAREAQRLRSNLPPDHPLRLRSNEVAAMCSSEDAAADEQDQGGSPQRSNTVPPP